MDPLSSQCKYTILNKHMPEKSESIGAKDIRLLKIFNERLEILNNQCELTFKDGIKAACQLTLNEIIDIFKHKAFTGKLEGTSPDSEHMKLWYRAQPVPTYASVPDFDKMNDNAIAWMHKKAKKKSQAGV